MELMNGSFLEHIGIPKKLMNAHIATYTVNNESQKAALLACINYTDVALERIKDGKGLFIHGPVGTGKTHLAIATIKALINKYPEEFEPGREYYRSRPNIRTSFISVVYLLSVIRESFKGLQVKQEKAEKMLFAAKYHELIVLDDIGAEKPSEWVEEQLYSIIDHRYRQEKATILTTNCSIAELENQLGKRIASRIIEMTTGIKVDGEDYRKRKLK